MANRGLGWEVCYAPLESRFGDGFARTARHCGTADTNPFDAAAIGSARPVDPARGRWCGGARECTGTRCVAEDGAVLAQAVAAGSRGAVRPRPADRRAATGSSGEVHARTGLCVGRDDLREAVRKRATDQP